MEKIPFKTDKNGTKYYYDWTCSRCGGAGGADQWKFTGWKCYDCGGTGKSTTPSVYKEYTPEYQAKLDARRAKRQAKREAEAKEREAETRAEWLEKHQFNADGDTFLFLGDTFIIRERIKETGAMYNAVLGWHIANPVDGFEYLKVNIDEIATHALYWGYTITATFADIEAKKAAAMPAKQNLSKHVGNVGDRITFNAKYIRCASWENNFISWRPTTTYLYSFEDENGNVFIWKTGKGLPQGVEIGDPLTISGTIKEHDEYKEVKQTVLTRCVIAKTV